MIIKKGPTQSLWTGFKAPSRFQPLYANLTTEVCIVGAGIAGMTAAYLLGLEGVSVIVLDDGPIGGGESCRTTAHLANAIDDRYWQMEKLHGSEGARLAADSHTQAINKIESIIREEDIDCDFKRVDGYLFEPPGQSVTSLDRELEAARRAGVSVEKVLRAPLDFFDTGPALCFKNQAQFNPMKYLAALTSLAQSLGAKIFTNTHVTKVSGNPSPHVDTDQGHSVQAGSVIIATNTPFNDRVIIHTKQAAYRTYAIGARIPAGSVPQALFWDDLHGEGSGAYHYVRTSPMPDGEYLIVGGEDHKTGQAHDTQERFKKLEGWARERFPMMQTVEWQWSGQVMETIDGLAFIGRNPRDHQDIYIATGDSGMGMTHGTIAGMLLTDLICGHQNDWEKLYDPSRKTLQATLTYARENTNTILQYADWFTKGEVSDVEEIEPGEGAVVRDGLKKIAVYRDDHGRLHAYSAVCPHLDGIVSWNPTEKSWDCPCHGSRFSCYGQVINGPSPVDLHAAELPEERETAPVGPSDERILGSTP